MSFAAVMHRFGRENVLWSVLLELTYRCNLSCSFCYNDLALRGTPLGTERYLELLAELEALGVMSLILSGGEPLAHPDFLRIGAAARERGFAVRIKSNGHAFRGELARRIRDRIDPFLVEVSLHGARAESHERQTRVRGSFARLLQNLEEMIDLGLRVKLIGTLTRWNEDEVAEMFALADRFGLPLQWSTEVTPRDDGDPTPLTLAASRAGMARLYRGQMARFERARGVAGGGAEAPGETREQGHEALAEAGNGDKHCGAGSSTLAIDPYGNVYPCVQWRRPLGNLHRRTIAEIWDGSPALESVRREGRAVKEVIDGEGARGRLMSFCPGSARLETGSARAIYPGARARAEVLDALRREREELGVQTARRERLPIVS